MINDARFSDEMVDLLRSLKGKTFKSYECVKVRDNAAYGKCRLNMGTFSLNLYNYTHVMPFFGAYEDIPVFECEIVDKDSDFGSDGSDEVAHVYMIDEIVKEVEIINDDINVNDDEYRISIDQALVLRTKYNVYTFYKDWMYSELINFGVDRNEPVLYEKEKVEYEWSDAGKDKIAVKRTSKSL